MTTLTLAEAQARLADLIHGLTPGDEVVITENDKQVARLTVTAATEKPRPVAGRGKGMLIVLSEDDDHLKDFEDYLP